MNVNFEKLPHVNPCEAFEHVRGRYIAQGFWRGVWTTLLVLVLVAVGIGYAIHHGVGSSKEPATGPIGDAPPLPTTEAVPPLPGDTGTPSKTATVPDVPGPPPIPGPPPGVTRK